MTLITEATDTQLEAAISQGTTVLVEFWAPWCGHCKAMSGVIERAAEHLQSRASVLTLNVATFPEAAERHHVQSVPALLLYRDGELKTRFDGFKRLPLILEQVRPYL